MKTEQEKEIGVKILRVVSNIFLAITILSAICFILNLCDSCVYDSVDYITPMLYSVGFGAMTVLTRLSEYK